MNEWMNEWMNERKGYLMNTQGTPKLFWGWNGGKFVWLTGWMFICCFSLLMQ